jgi:hypothetical protein
MGGLDIRLEGLTILVDPLDVEVEWVLQFFFHIRRGSGTEFSLTSVVFVHDLTGHPQRTWIYNGEVMQRDDRTQSEDCCEPPSKIRRFLGGETSRTTSVHTNVYWPQDVLPITLINAWIMTYG